MALLQQLVVAPGGLGLEASFYLHWSQWQSGSTDSFCKLLWIKVSDKCKFESECISIKLEIK